MIFWKYPSLVYTSRVWPEDENIKQPDHFFPWNQSTLVFVGRLKTYMVILMKEHEWMIWMKGNQCPKEMFIFFIPWVLNDETNWITLVVTRVILVYVWCHLWFIIEKSCECWGGGSKARGMSGGSDVINRGAGRGNQSTLFSDVTASGAWSGEKRTEWWSQRWDKMSWLHKIIVLSASN